MDDIRGRIRDDLHAPPIGPGPKDDFEESAIFEEVDRRFSQALGHDEARAISDDGDPLFSQPLAAAHPRALPLPARIEDPWRPKLPLEFPRHRGWLPAGAIRLAKSRLVLPMVSSLFEYS